MCKNMSIFDEFAISVSVHFLLSSFMVDGESAGSVKSFKEVLTSFFSSVNFSNIQKYFS